MWEKWNREKEIQKQTEYYNVKGKYHASKFLKAENRSGWG